MRLLSTININTIKTYNPVKIKTKNKIKSWEFHNWCKSIPKSLQEICVEAIAKNWTEKPILHEIPLPTDKYTLLEILPEDLPLNLTIPLIDDSIYWKKCCKKRWPRKFLENVIDESASHKRTWKQYYIERHIQEYLETLKCENYDAEKIKELCDLCSPYVNTLEIREMQFSKTTGSRIPLNAIMTGFKNLTELSICFKQIHAEDDFSWNILKTSHQDIKLLGKGLEQIRLKTFRIWNSDIDDDKLIIILKSLLKHSALETLDISHCKIGNVGLKAISKFILDHPVSTLILTNNNIDDVEFLSYVLSQQSCILQHLNLKLNKIGNEGGAQLMKYINYNEHITSLNVSGCGFTNQLVEIEEMLKVNCLLEILDISNNNIGEVTGRNILCALRSNATLRSINVRMCKINSETELEIQQQIETNRNLVKTKSLERPKLPEELKKVEIMTELETILD